MTNLSSKNTSNLNANSLQDDEVDIKEILMTLWRERLVVFLTFIISIFVAVAYSYIAEVRWEAKGVITEPSFGQYSKLIEKVSEVELTLSYSSYEEKVNKTNELQKRFDSKTLLSTFVAQFNLKQNKFDFLENDEAFQSAYQYLWLEEKRGKHSFYKSWYDKFSINKQKKPKQGKNQPDVYIVSMVSNNSQESFEVLVRYLDFVNKKAQSEVVNNLQNYISMHKKNLYRDVVFFVGEAQERLYQTKLKVKYALKIAEESKIKRPLSISRLRGSDFFPAHWGEDLLRAELNLLDDLDDLNSINVASFEEIENIEQLNLLNKLDDLMIFNNSLSKSRKKLDLLTKLTFEEPIFFESIKVVNSIEAPNQPSSPNKLFILIGGGLLGIAFGVVVVFIRSFLNKHRKIMASRLER